jgi:hypothetical protein
MKIRSTVSPLAMLILAAFVVTTSPSAAANLKDQGPSVSGAGQFRAFHPETARRELWSFSFEARANKKDHATGHAVFENLTAQTQVVVRINCLTVNDSAFAVMTGRVLHSDDPLLPKSENVVFAIRDGQLLPTPSFDTITPLFTFFGDCHDGEPLTILPLENGDIEIQP